MVDRYKAYQAMTQVKSGLIVLAFCWAHVRRDFLTVARTWPDQEAWALGWVDGSASCTSSTTRGWRSGGRGGVRGGRRAVACGGDGDGAQGEAELAEPALHPARRKVLESLGNHWTGLTVFVEHPEVPMDNNTAERASVGRWWGGRTTTASGAVWAGQLAAMLFSLFQTLCLWD